MKSRRVKFIKKYLSKTERVGNNITEIVNLFHEKPGHSALNKFIDKPLDAITAFKTLLLIHALINQQAIDLSICSQMLRKMTFYTTNSFNALISQNYVNPYRLFLQKRCQINLNSKPESQQDLEVFIFQLLNIIRAASTFQQVIYTFGRYFANKYVFIIDFNIVLAKDISKIYSTIQTTITQPYSGNLLQEIELIHETMYPIYFNNYFFMYIKNYRPNWIQTDIATPSTPQTQKKSFSNDKKQNSTAYTRHKDSNYLKEVGLCSINENEQYIVDAFEANEEDTKEELCCQRSPESSNKRCKEDPKTKGSSQQDSIDAKSIELSQIKQCSEYLVQQFEVDSDLVADITKSPLLFQPSPLQINSFHQ